MSQLEKILAWAEGQVKSTKWSGKCQSFVAHAYEAGTGKYASKRTAAMAREAWLKPGTANDLKPPAGAAVYFTGVGRDSSGKLYGHVALSAGNGLIYDPVAHVYKSYLKKNMYNGYLGWGWNGGVAPEGASVSSQTASTVNKVSTGTVPTSSVSASSDSKQNEKKNIEISTVVIKSEVGKISGKSSSSITQEVSDSDLFLLVQGDDKIYKPYIADEIKVTRERTGAPGKMTFSYIDIEGMNISEGNAVAFRYKNKKVFFGYIFTLERDSDREKVNVTCYDQLRYFKNKDSFVYSSKYSDMLKNYICKKYGFKTGIIEDTIYKIPKRLEDGSLFDICANASTFTILSNGKHFVLYDDFGNICLRDMENMMLPILIDEDVTGKWNLKESIDSDVYNRIIVKKDNSETGERELYIANDSKTQSKWGVLSYVEDGDENSSASALKSKANSLLKYYNRPNQTFKITNCLGHVDVRGGSSLLVSFYLGNGKKIQNEMVVDKVEHTFSENSHFMDMNLYGGVYSA